MKTLTTQLPVPFNFSQSSLQDYNDCERRFYLRYLDQLTWPAVESEPIIENEQHQLEGQIFHRLVQQHWLGLPVDKLSQLANTPALRQWWENFLNFEFDLGGYHIFPELSLNSQVGKHRLTAKYDLVAIREGKILIYDWKTYNKRPREDLMAKTYQTRVYRSLLVQAGSYLIDNKRVIPETIEMVYWLANSPTQTIRFPYNTSQFNRDWQHLEAMISRIDTHLEYPMTMDDKKCKYCSYRSYCDRGISAAYYDEDSEPLLEISDLTWDNITEIEY